MKKTIASIVAGLTALLGALGAFWGQIADTFSPKEEEVKTEQVMPSINISQSNSNKQSVKQDVETGDVSIDDDE